MLGVDWQTLIALSTHEHKLVLRFLGESPEVGTEHLNADKPVKWGNFAANAAEVKPFDHFLFIFKADEQELIAVGARLRCRRHYIHQNAISTHGR